VSEPSSIAVVGGGIIGSTIAWRLAQRGKQVTIFEKGQIGGEASWAAAGMLSPGGELDEQTYTPQAELYVRSRQQYRAFVDELSRESGISIDYSDCGAMELAYTAEEWSELKARAVKQRAFGIISRELSPDQVRVFSPHVQIENLMGAVFYPEDGVVAPREVMNALKAVCRDRDVELRERSLVEEIEVTAKYVAINGQRFESAVVAAGAWSGSLRVKGVPPLPGSEPVKGHLLGFDLQIGACPAIVRHKNIYVFQRGSGFVVAGASTERVGFERAIDAAVSEQLFRDVTRILPVLEKVQAVDVWTGFRPKSEKLFLGRWHDSRLYLAYGHYRNGILLAPVSADEIVSAMLPTAPYPDFSASGAHH
jgi:glycine oxidase